jgi:thiol-disulfide isomerase/thioredoxin
MKPGADSREPGAETPNAVARFAPWPRARRFRLPASGFRLLAFFVLPAASLSPCSALAQDEQIGLARGAVVQPFSLADLDGHTVDLGQVIGRKPVLVEFWATWCGNCTALEPRMRAAYQRHGSDVEFVIVAVGVNQTPASVQRHLARHALPASRVLWDGNGVAVRAFQTPATSYVVLLDRQGKVAYTGLGPDQDLEAALARVAR